MTTTHRPSSLVVGWAGAWAFNVRYVLTALRDQGPLTVIEAARILRPQALHADLTSGHGFGPEYGSEMLVRAVLEDANALVSVDAEGRYSVPADLTSFHSPYTDMTIKLHTIDEAAAAKIRADAERPVRRWNSSRAYDRFGGKWTDGRLPGRKHAPEDVDEMADTIRSLGWLPGARIVKDQHGVTIEGHLRADALGLLGIDPDTGTDPRSGEPYVEIRSFNNDAARLLYALTANWLTLKAPTRKALSHQVFGDQPLTLEAVRTLLLPLADVMVNPAPVTEPAPMMEPLATTPVMATPVMAPRRPRPRNLSDEDRDMIAAIDRCGHEGATQAELRALGGDQGSVTGRLSRLTDDGRIVLLAEKRGVGRGRSGVYVTPKWVEGRPVGDRRSNPKRTTYSNTKVATMSWREAVPASPRPGSEPPFVQHGKGRIYAQTGASAEAPVAEHIPGIINYLNSATPWLLPMICECLAQAD